MPPLPRSPSISQDNTSLSIWGLEDLLQTVCSGVFQPQEALVAHVLVEGEVWGSRYIPMNDGGEDLGHLVWWAYGSSPYVQWQSLTPRNTSPSPPLIAFWILKWFVLAISVLFPLSIFQVIDDQLNRNLKAAKKGLWLKRSSVKRKSKFWSAGIIARHSWINLPLVYHLVHVIIEIIQYFLYCRICNLPCGCRGEFWVFVYINRLDSPSTRMMRIL